LSAIAPEGMFRAQAALPFASRPASTGVGWTAPSANDGNEKPAPGFCRGCGRPI